MFHILDPLYSVSDNTKQAKTSSLPQLLLTPSKGQTAVLKTIPASGMLSVTLDKAAHLVLSLQRDNTIYFTELQGELTSNFRDLVPHDSEKEVAISIP